MLIDWFTVFAQAVNFVVLILILKAFLYKPIVRAMKSREQKVRSALQDAETLKQEAVQELDKAKKEKAHILTKKEELMAEAEAAVGRWRDEAIARAEQDVAEKKMIWEEGFRSDISKSYHDIQKNIIQQVVDLSRKVLRDLADQALEEQVVSHLLVTLREERAKDSALFERAYQHVVLEVSFPLVEEHKDNALQELKKIFPGAEKIHVLQSQNHGFGVRLKADEKLWEWSLKSYLQDLERAMIARLGLKESDLT